MKIRAMFLILVLFVLAAGCGGAKKPVSGTEADQIVSGLDSNTFEFARNELIVQPFPTVKDTEDFQFVYPVIMEAPTRRYNNSPEPKFMKDLAELLQRDLGIDLDYEKMAGLKKAKVTKKPGFVWDPELYWPIAVKKVRAGKNKIEMYTRVTDSRSGPDPLGLDFETVIQVKSGSKLLKEYHSRAGYHPEIRPDLIKAQLIEYFVHIPELKKHHMPDFYMGNTAVREKIKQLWGN
jgi:hypothetical protein